MMAVREAFLIFSSSIWKDNHKLLIDSDSSNVVKWTIHPDMAPWRMRKVVLQLERLKEELEGWEIRHVRREANQRSDALAKQGAYLQYDILRIFSHGFAVEWRKLRGR
ncbi:Uncharacterized protein TCM_009399 [Theobroma cacao]|uniref:RNase H type-1 domain-containing protein n=1 Tax=Theobroma cacao TaxID=3641 RepID=A0A061E5W9_THECC|nr:Uncharacterized protein TCM_009399 [Theobroma cacao]